MTYFDTSRLNPIATATTDADGKFHITLPTDQTLVIAAQAERQMGNQSERYAWLLVLTDKDNVVLNNNNIIGRDAPNSLIGGN